MTKETIKDVFAVTLKILRPALRRRPAFSEVDMIKIETYRTNGFNGFSMDYFSFGNGKKTLVVIPGLSIKSVMDNAEAIADAYKLMQDDFTIYVFDRRRELPRSYSISEMAKDTYRVMKELRLNDIYLFGVSQGGMIAMSIAIEHPGFVKKLVLGSTSSHITNNQLTALNKWIDLAKKRDAEALCLSFGELIYPPEVFEQYRDYLLDMSKTVTDEDIDRFIILASGTKGFHLTEILKVIRCPVLAIGVYEDPVLDSDATMEMAEQMDWNGNFKLYMYTGFGHAAYDTAPDYCKRVYDFFMND